MMETYWTIYLRFLIKFYNGFLEAFGGLQSELNEHFTTKLEF